MIGSVETAPVTVSPAGPHLWAARTGDGVLLGFGRSRGEARRVATMASSAPRFNVMDTRALGLPGPVEVQQ